VGVLMPAGLRELAPFTAGPTLGTKGAVGVYHMSVLPSMHCHEVKVLLPSFHVCSCMQ